MKYSQLFSLLLFVLFMSCFSFNGIAQEENNTEEDIIQDLNAQLNAGLGILFKPESRNKAAVSQIGLSNESKINQITTLQGQGNQAIVIQNGDGNQIDMLQNGEFNKSNVIQYGNGNFYELSLDGERNSSYVLQNGNHNTVSQDMTGSDLSYGILQYGNGNEVRQIENSNLTDMPAYQLTQIGNNMKIEIKQSKIY